MLENKSFKNLKEEVKPCLNENKDVEEEIDNKKSQLISPEYNSRGLRTIEKPRLSKKEIIHDKS